eukprot:TRINITY_DN6405_c0_g1_i1.p1 TRINITY_DN6405_c0_g1~~TRINITY_DN6405_c0_g1_i1.p1  ORF type:complete len:499 (+),score=91.16 TRINITY_DN6405_c0_g1_i1:115-1611(+)
MAQQQNKKTPEDFEFNELLGEGSFARVVSARLIATGVEYAVKIVDKKFITKHNKQQSIMTERQCLNTLNHPNIIKLYYTFQDADSLYFVLELATKGELYHIIKDAGRLDLEGCRYYAGQLLNAIEYMHSVGIIHRDLKPENLLLSATGQLKVTDFGTAKIENSPPAVNPAPPPAGANRRASGRKNSFVGTAEYVSPELLQYSQVGKSGDIWAYGCILYHMLCGYPPFRAASEYLTFQKILRQEFSFPPELPEVAVDLIRALLKADPQERLSPSQIKEHPFFAGIDFENLHQQPPPEIPQLAPYPRPDGDSLAQNFELLEVDDAEQDDLEQELASRHAPPPNNYNLNQFGADDVKTSSPHSSPLLAASSTPASPSLSPLSPPTSPNPARSADHNQWRRFLLDNEEIVYTEYLQKGQYLSKTKRQLLLTSLPRFIYIDVAKMEKRGEIEWSSKLYPELKDETHWNLHTPNREWYFQCFKPGAAQAWVDIINSIRRQRSGI